MDDAVVPDEFIAAGANPLVTASPKLVPVMLTCEVPAVLTSNGDDFSGTPIFTLDTTGALNAMTIVGCARPNGVGMGDAEDDRDGDDPTVAVELGDPDIDAVEEPV